MKYGYDIDDNLITTDDIKSTYDDMVALTNQLHSNLIGCRVDDYQLWEIKALDRNPELPIDDIEPVAVTFENDKALYKRLLTHWLPHEIDMDNPQLRAKRLVGWVCINSKDNGQRLQKLQLQINTLKKVLDKQIGVVFNTRHARDQFARSAPYLKPLLMHTVYRYQPLHPSAPDSTATRATFSWCNKQKKPIALQDGAAAAKYLMRQFSDDSCLSDWITQVHDEKLLANDKFREDFVVYKNVPAHPQMSVTWQLGDGVKDRKTYKCHSPLLVFNSDFKGKPLVSLSQREDKRGGEQSLGGHKIKLEPAIEAAGLFKRRKYGPF